jgi:hypothetical protein
LQEGAAQKSHHEARDGMADRAESMLMGRGCRYVAAGEAGEDLDHEAGVSDLPAANGQ